MGRKATGSRFIRKATDDLPNFLNDPGGAQMSKFIGTFLFGIAPIAILGLGAEVHAQDDVDCYHCVDSRDIDSEAITTNKIEPKAVTTNKLAKRAVTSGKLCPTVCHFRKDQRRRGDGC